VVGQHGFALLLDIHGQDHRCARLRAPAPPSMLRPLSSARTTIAGHRPSASHRLAAPPLELAGRTRASWATGCPPWSFWATTAASTARETISSPRRPPASGRCCAGAAAVAQPPSRRLSAARCRSARCSSSTATPRRPPPPTPPRSRRTRCAPRSPRRSPASARARRRPLRRPKLLRCVLR
jgi:hypothetical protein